MSGFDREKILKLADGIARLRGYTDAEIKNAAGVKFEATDGTPYTGQKLMLINAEHRELLVAALLLFAGPDDELQDHN